MTDNKESLQQGLPFLNRGLFSDHFLRARLPEWNEWQTCSELSTFQKRISDLYESLKAVLPLANEAQTEQELIQPILGLLGYEDSYIVQAPTRTGQQTNRPDYALFPDQTTKVKAYDRVKQNDYSLCIGLADAKHWERSLDLAQTNTRDTLTNANPSFQIAAYLTQTKQTWGILTNGRLWRLYSSRSHLPLGNYYQVDVVRLLLDSDKDSLKYFYLFFRKASLVQVDGKAFLDRVLEQSNQYAHELETDIKKRAYDVVQTLCRGFAAALPPDELQEQTLKIIYDNSLTLLYRLLFVLYAEARDLLPLTVNHSYRDKYSLHRLAIEIDETLSKGYQLSAKSSVYYQRVSSLFGLIDQGDSDLGVPEYNGGLFDPDEHPFLEQRAVPDAFLVQALQHLTRIQDEALGRQVAVDYNTLSERHLGSIYEGLLEYKPRIAPADLVEIRDKTSISYAPHSDYPAKKVAYRKGDLYLANDKGERKSSGSYFTPEHIVDYIVQNALGPLAKEAHERVKAMRPEVERDVAQWQSLKSQKQGLEPTEKYDREAARQRDRLLDPYLALKVLDPAMGSGHFLARATDFLAEAIATDPDITPPASITEDSELTYYRRRVVESCIYGVDLNPLAVELAKLTLWLGTMAKSRPLSFLNHHLRVGNSLIGARIADLDEIPKVKRKGKAFDPSRAPVQIGQFEWAFNQKVAVLLKSRAMIAQLPTQTLEDVHNKVTWEREFKGNMRRFAVLGDLWVSTHFGVGIRWDEYNALAENLQAPEADWERLLKAKSLREGLAVARDKRFFHWELEFPEVFYDSNSNHKEDAGFDAVIGNPPYDVLAEKEQGVHCEPEKEFFRERPFLKPAIEAKLNYYRLFSALSIWLTRPSGYHGFIVPMALLGDAQARLLRTHMLTKTQVVFVEAFPQKDDPRNRIFEEAKLSTCVYVLVNRPPSSALLLRIHPGKHILEASPSVRLNRESIEMLDPKELSIPSMPGTTAAHIALGIALQNRCKGNRLGDIAASQQGEVNLTTHKAFLSDSPIGAEVLRGANVDRYRFNAEPKQGKPKYLDVVRFLHGREPDSKFFDHKGKRIGYQRGSAIDNWRRIIACIIQPNSFCSDTINYIANPNANLYFILGLLNSRLLEWRFRLTSTNNHVNSYEIDSLPLRRASATPVEERMSLVRQGKTACADFLDHMDNRPMLTFLDRCLPSQPDGNPDLLHERSDVVHDLITFLAEQMTVLIAKKQDAAMRFLSWLEAEILKAPVEEQTNKTAIKNFQNASFDNLIDVLKKNEAVPDPCPSTVRDTIAAEFNAAMGIIAPLKARIEATDRLIDQIVYRLYGLAPAEIAIVEGDTSSPPATLESESSPA